MAKVMIQDIARELNMSRNTISKALKNDESVAESTRARIIQVACAMGYDKLDPEVVEFARSQKRETSSGRYAILMTDRYRENRQTLEKKPAVIQTLSDTFVSIMTSGSVLTVVGFLLGWISSNQLLAQLGVFVGRGAVFSLIIVLFVLPGLLYVFDRFVMREKKSKSKGKVEA